MNIPQLFYYSQTQSTLSYSRTPSGLLAIKELIEGKPCWISPSLTRMEMKKKLILADWTARHWRHGKINQVKEALKELMAQGFVIYRWSDGRVVPMNSSSLSSLDKSSIRNEMVPATAYEIATAAVTHHNIPRDQVQVVDDYWLAHVLSPENEIKPRVLKISDLVHLPPSESIEWVNHLKKNTPPLTQIIHDEFSKEANDMATSLANEFPDIDMIHDYTIASIHLDDHDDSLGNFTIQPFDLTFEQLAKIEEIHLISRTKSIDRYKYISKILTAAPNLKIIDLRGCENINDGLDFREIDLSSLEFIELSGSHISSVQLKKLLNAAPNLKIIDLKGCENISDELDFRGVNLSSLESIDLSYSPLSSAQLNQLLNAAPNLKIIHLDQCENINGEQDFSEVNLSSLESISLMSTNISSVQLQQILRVSPKLKAIHLMDCPNQEDEIEWWEGIDLSSLESIHLWDTNLSSVQLQKLLRRASNLKTIRLDQCQNLDDGLEWQAGIDLSSLESIHLWDTNLSSVQLQKILCAAPNLKVIRLDQCPNLDDGLQWSAEVDLSSLESIQLLRTNISSVQLQKILRAATNLRILDLNNCPNLDDGLEWSTKIDLSSLDSLHLFRTNISSVQLQEILHTATHLKSISLVGSSIIGDLDLSAITLMSLKSIELSRTNISFLNLKKILSSAPNLNTETISQIESMMKSSAIGLAPSDHMMSFNPAHDPKEMKSFEPKSKKAPFQFKAIQNTRNQGMIIGRFCQYLTLTQQHLDAIPKLQDGICNALSHYFLTLDPVEWAAFINNCLAWNGNERLDEELSSHFLRLYQYIETYQLKDQPKAHYLGDQLNAYLLSTHQPVVLNNPWHTIAIRPSGAGIWQVYDPNFNTGSIEVTSEKLLPLIHASIGELISVEQPPTQRLALNRPNPDNFIEHGGLLVLFRCENASKVLSTLPEEHRFSKEALDGILLRDTTGSPAWLLALASRNPSLQTLARELLRQFEAMHEQAAPEQLLKSMEALTPAQKGECITLIIQAGTAPEDTTHSTLIESIRQSSNTAAYANALKTWDKTIPLSSTILHYCQHCLQAEHQKHLVELDSTQHLNTLREQLQRVAAKTSRPLFYIDQPDDLICSAPWVEKHPNQTGTLHNGPGGPLYFFLQENRGKKPVILVNYEHFNADDMVRFNGLLDKIPLADGTPLPDDTFIIGLINHNKPDCYQGSDFYSRFDQIEQCPVSTQQMKAIQPEKTIASVDLATLPADENTFYINLYHATDWKERLLGRWVLDGEALTYQAGALFIPDLTPNHSLVIQNGLWNEPSFILFWQQLTSHGIWHAGELFKAPPGLLLIRPETESLDWKRLKRNVQSINNGVSNEPVPVLNPTRLGDFFGRHEVSGNKLMKQPGWIQQAKENGGLCPVNLTRNLSDNDWAMLLDECERQTVQLILHVGIGIQLPPEWEHPATISPIPMPFSRGENEQDDIILSTDTDTTLVLLTTTKTYVVIDVSECSASDLLTRLDGRLNQDSLRFEFNQSDAALTIALAENKSIVLKGRFSKELLDSLAALMIERSLSNAPGKIRLILDSQTDLPYGTNHVLHQVSAEEKRACLTLNENILEKIEPFLDQESLSQLNARCRFLELHPHGKSDDAWIGMNSLPARTPTLTTAINKAFSAIETAEWMKMRATKINEVLASEPYVFLSGLSGVGKSTFVERELCKHNDVLYLTEQQIQDWASDASDKRKILFLDEANLTPRQWSEFEGLYQVPPSILIQGKLHPLTEHHKVIFAGNPVSYGDERQLAPFFQRHGNAVRFDPLPLTVIYEKILKPILKDWPQNQEPIADRILDIYHFVSQCSTTELLISPRELQMMALITLTRAQQYPALDPLILIEHVSHALAKTLVPEINQMAFEDQFKPQHPMPLNSLQPTTQPHPFLITESRQKVSEQINDLLNLRQWRRESLLLNSAQKTGGLGGMIIEGEPGIGKSELVIAALIQRGYQEVHDFIHPTSIENPFYRLPISTPLKEKENLLIKAFYEGAVVIMDEMNSSPMMERLLNDLLMHKTPHHKEELVPKPGFILIGTQNPITMAGRRASSTALKRRVISTTLPEYKPEEITAILLAKGISPNDAEAMIKAYTTQRSHAIEHQLSPVPNFRNLMNIADEQLNSIKRVTASAQEPGLTEQDTSARLNATLTPEQSMRKTKAIKTDLTALKQTSEATLSETVYRKK